MFLGHDACHHYRSGGRSRFAARPNKVKNPTLQGAPKAHQWVRHIVLSLLSEARAPHMDRRPSFLVHPRSRSKRRRPVTSAEQVINKYEQLVRVRLTRLGGTATAPSIRQLCGRVPSGSPPGNSQLQCAWVEMNPTHLVTCGQHVLRQRAIPVLGLTAGYFPACLFRILLYHVVS